MFKRFWNFIKDPIGWWIERETEQREIELLGKTLKEYLREYTPQEPHQPGEGE